MAEQLDFFGAIGQATGPFEDESEPAGLEWSYSRRDILEQCPRRYYYSYYGASVRTAKTEPRKEELRFLKGLTNCSMRSGDILHLVIRAYLKRLRTGEEWAQDRIVRWARDIYGRDLDFSRRYHAGDPLPDGADAAALLLEFYFGFANAAGRWASTEEQLVAALTNFITLPALAFFRAGATKEEALIERPMILKDPYFSMRGKIDLAFPSNQRFAVVDWKIGGSANGEESLQLTSYAMAAMNKLGCLPDDIDLYRVHLGSGLMYEFTVSNKHIQRARARIIQDVERMKALDGYGRNAETEAFTPCGQVRVCAMCPFQELCPKEVKQGDRDEYSHTQAGT